MAYAALDSPSALISPWLTEGRVALRRPCCEGDTIGEIRGDVAVGQQGVYVKRQEDEEWQKKEA